MRHAGELGSLSSSCLPISNSFGSTVHGGASRVRSTLAAGRSPSRGIPLCVPRARPRALVPLVRSSVLALVVARHALAQDAQQQPRSARVRRAEIAGVPKTVVAVAEAVPAGAVSRRRHRRHSGRPPTTRVCRRSAESRARSAQPPSRTFASSSGCRRIGTASSCRRATAAPPARSSTTRSSIRCCAGTRSPTPTRATRVRGGDFAWAVGQPQKLDRLPVSRRARADRRRQGDYGARATAGRPTSRTGSAARRAGARA